jgi:hypothetical protein
MMEDGEGWAKTEMEVCLWQKKLTTCRPSRYQHDWLTAPRKFRQQEKNRVSRAFPCHHCLDYAMIDPLRKPYALLTAMPITLAI